jgi:hypothetical protein
VATDYNSHGDTSFQVSEFGIPIILLEGIAMLSLAGVIFELTFNAPTDCRIPKMNDRIRYLLRMV